MSRTISHTRYVKHTNPKGFKGTPKPIRNAGCPLGYDCPGNGDCDSCYIASLWSHAS